MLLLSVESGDAAKAGEDLSLIGAWSDRQNKRRRVRNDSFRLCGEELNAGGRVYPDELSGCRLIYAQLDRACVFFSRRSEAD